MSRKSKKRILSGLRTMQLWEDKNEIPETCILLPSSSPVKVGNEEVQAL